MRAPFLARTVRTNPYLYSAICKARLFYSRRVAGARTRSVYAQHRDLFVMNDVEECQVESLRSRGYALLPTFFPSELIGRLFAAADAMFRNLQIDFKRAYSVQTGERTSLEGLSYDELAASEKMISLRDPLAQIPELLGVAFHESILKIAANFLGYVTPLYRVTVVRDFPHNRPLHSSNFHKDNDESDSLQIFIYLVDIDDTRGPLVYIPGSNHYDVRSCRPRLSRDLGLPGNDGRLSDEEVERVYPRDLGVLCEHRAEASPRFTAMASTKALRWTHPATRNNQPRTAIKLDLHGYKTGVIRDGKENRISKLISTA